ncbi:MAG: amidohydrolase family protein [Gemmatimonadota bacterium]
MTSEPIDPSRLAAANGPVWLHVGTLIDGASTSAAHDVHVVYNASSVLFIGRAGLTPPRALLREGQSTPDVVAPESTLLPGLTDAHVHLFLDGAELDLGRRAEQVRRPLAELLPAATKRLEKLLDSGVIAVRDAGDKQGVGLALNRLSRSAAAPMPYLDSPGAGIHRKGRYGSFMGGALDDFDSPEACVASRIEAGAARIKIIATGIIDFRAGTITSEPQMRTDELARIVAAARAAGLQTLAHASGDAGIERVIDAGVDSVEHGYFVRDDQLARMRDLGIAWVPTFAPLHQQIAHADVMGWDSRTVDNIRRILDGHAASLRRAHELGVIIVAGSDAGSFGVAHGSGLHLELELMVAAGLPDLAVINSATGAGAARFEYRERFGLIAEGYRPRFILSHGSGTTVPETGTPLFDGQVRGLGSQASN